MDKIIEIIKQLQNTSSTNDKLNILKQNKDNKLLQKTLEYTYNPFKKYKITEKVIQPILNKSSEFLTIFELLDDLSKNNINDNLRNKVNLFLGAYSYNNDLFELYKMMLLKDLKINLGIKSINKVWKDLIPEFNVMLAESYFKQKEGFLNGRNFILSTKLDGNRLVIIKKNGIVEMYTRQGKLMIGLIEIENDAKQLPDNMVYDGELIAENINNLPSDELFRETMTKARKDGEKTGLIFNCFDMLPVDEFEKGSSKLNAHDRKLMLEDTLLNLSLTHIVNVKTLYEGNDESKIIEYLNWAKANNLEGIMCQLSDGNYQCKRTKNILKVKAMQTCDLEVIGFEEGQGNFKGVLGAVIVKYKNNTVKVGSGWSMEQRQDVWNNRDKYLGRILEVQYFEESIDSKTKLPSLRFPIAKAWREEGKEVSYN